jgi:hypothetical protein
MEKKSTKMLIVQNQFASTTTVWVLFLFLGWSYGSLGKVGLQIVYYITFGGLGIWTLIRLFTLNGAIKTYNKELAIKQGLSADEMMQLGVI